MARSIASNGVVFETLTNDNYYNWSILTKNYLMSKDLWVDIIEDPKQTPENASESRSTTTHGTAELLREKDARALEIIRSSCGPEAFSSIQGITTAKIAWDILEKEYGSRQRRANPDIQLGDFRERLTEDNYDQWSTMAKNHLITKDLWVDIIDDCKHTAENASKFSTTTPQGTDDESSSKWKKKNAKALHIIQMSCGSETVSQIKETKTAKNAWNTLASLYRSKLRANPDIEQGLTPLHRGVQRGDWDSARMFVDKNRSAIYETSKSGRTALHLAVLYGQDDMVKKLANINAPTWLLKERDAEGYTALALAAELTDSTDIAKCMVDTSEDLLTIKTYKGLIPVVLAAVQGHKKMTKYLYEKTPKYMLNEDNGRTSALLLTRCITSQIFDVALDLLQRNPRLPLAHKFDGDVSPIYALAQQSSAFPSVNPPTFWLRYLYDSITHDEDGRAINITLPKNRGKGRKYIITCAGRLSPVLGFVVNHVRRVFLRLPGIRKIYKKKMTHFQAVEILKCMAKGIMGFNESELQEALVYESMLEASKSGIAEFIVLMTEANPDLYWVIDENERGIFSYAIMNRREKIFNLIYDLKGQGKVIISRKDIFGNNMLHFTGILAPLAEFDRRSGPALQMQRELQWFKAVKRILHPKFQQDKNGDDLKPRELFNKKHEELLKEGEKWAMETARSFTVVGTLIITTMFAAAFNVPGKKDEPEIPIYLHKRMYTAFIITDILSLFTSATSVTTFIGILTSRYTEKDFLTTLPFKLMIGLSTLICSLLSMMATFCLALSLRLWDHGRSWIVIAAVCIAGLSLLVFLPIKLRLLVEIFNSTFRSKILNKKKLV